MSNLNKLFGNIISGDAHWSCFSAPDILQILSVSLSELANVKLFQKIIVS